MEAGAPKSLVRKLAEVMAAVERVPKSGRNDFHKYDYATEADITAAVRSAMASRHLMMVPSIEHTEWKGIPRKNGGEDRLCTLTVRFTVMDGESDESLTFLVLGEGQDPGDKATYKAFTGAVKYALLKLFLIPTGDDPEHEDEEQRPRGKKEARAEPTGPSEEQKRRMSVLVQGLKDRGLGSREEVGDFFRKAVGSERYQQWKPEEWTKATEAVAALPEKATAKPTTAEPAAPASAPTPTPERAEAERIAPKRRRGAELAVAFGPHKGRPISEVSDEQLTETIRFGEEKLAKEPKAAWAAPMRENLAALETELETRIASDAPKKEPGSDG